MNTFLLIIFILLAIIVGLIIHELGHFIFAKLFKVSVKEFTIGIGPKIFSKQFKNTKVSFGILPVMAFVRIDSFKSIALYSELAKDYQNEMNELIAKYGNRVFDKKGVSFVNKNGKKQAESNFMIWYKYHKLENKFNHYQLLATRIKDSVLVDEIKKYQQFIIYFAGIFFNLILFAIFYLIQYFGFNYINNPFKQVGDSFLLLLKNMVFYNAWGSEKNPGTAFGSIADLGNSVNLLTSYQIKLIIVNYFTIFNIVIFFFNLLPIPPLDGYKILLTFISKLSKVKVKDNVKTTIELIGMGLMVYIFITAIIADFLV